jgi:hypothetical protein
MSIEATITLAPEDCALQVTEAHRRGLESMVGSLRHFSEAGLHLKKAQNTVENFTSWLKDNIPFSRKTAYQYIQLHDKVSAGLVNLDSGEFTSIRQCLGIDHDGEKSTYQEDRKNDPRFESIPGLCAKIEQNFKTASRAKPVETWSEDEKRVLANALQPIDDIYLDLLK